MLSGSRMLIQRLLFSASERICWAPRLVSRSASVKTGGLQVDVHAVLDGLALGHLVKHQNGADPGVGVGGD